MSFGMSVTRRALVILALTGTGLLLFVSDGGAYPHAAQLETGDNAPAKRKEQKPAPKVTKKTQKEPSPEPSPDADILKHIKLDLIIDDWGGLEIPAQSEKAPSVNIWSRERGELPVKQAIKKFHKNERGYSFTIDRGLSIRKTYWVTFVTADGRLSGEALMRQPEREGETITVKLKLYPKVDLVISVKAANRKAAKEVLLHVVEKGASNAGTSIPYETDENGKATFSKGLNPDEQYVVSITGEPPFEIDKSEIKNGKINKEITLNEYLDKTIVKVVGDNGPLADADITIALPDSLVTARTTEKGEAAFSAEAEKITSIEITHPDYEEYYCGGEHPEPCPVASQQGVVSIPLKRKAYVNGAAWDFGWLKSAVSLAFVVLVAAFIAAGFILLYRLRSREAELAPPALPIIEMSQQYNTQVAVTLPAPREGSETAVPQDASQYEPHPINGLGLPPASLPPPSDETSSVSPPSSPGSYPVPHSLSFDVAKEAYQRWIRREKLSREPKKLDLILNNNADIQCFQFRETRDPGSKFILFTDGENKGWLFPNPAPGVFQTEVEQTWRLVFRDLSKDEFARKKERLNPVEADRVTGSAGKGMWTAQSSPCQFA